jgi:hypothetical protein
MSELDRAPKTVRPVLYYVWHAVFILGLLISIAAYFLK